MIMPESRPFDWNREEWRRHIESVLVLTGMYEGDLHILRRISAPGFFPPTIVCFRRTGGDVTLLAKSFHRDFGEAISAFMAVERMPSLGEPAK